MVDVERVIRLLEGVHQDLSRLRQRGTDTPDDLDAIKYRFITAIEGAARAAHHIAVSEGWTTPGSNADAFATLAAEQVIASDLAEYLGEASGFRNVLVHQYAEVDNEKVVANLARLNDLDEYVRQVGEWLKTVG